MSSLTDFIDFSQPSFKATGTSRYLQYMGPKRLLTIEISQQLPQLLLPSIPFSGMWLLDKEFSATTYTMKLSKPNLTLRPSTNRNTLVLSSMWALGLTGTYLGDYFGILMDAPVTGFPFNVSSAPMYWGSTMSFLAVALYYGKAAGLVLTAEVFIVYWLALKWEDPFTAEIYAKRERDRAKAGKSNKRA
ncbi:methylene-fatty-acyl-phospholipid synthase [Uncinocarpus reesii 1704]|uniref:Phosphatidyl-N-methylethanolamine N-methyltransferase n=1 Tax=Uncinocarpus reesii (strain UAMH 1704) TaxID=336963 RepID=C4JTE4_UNCRE|nr:methylene-fatty-acyl-phospholipid synthase [Uncinocarpus reesii 1704]EEP80891.1 methylene-fatty-acyl-phospholipid synthase [Uncinocarpus reesii 1704]